MTTITSIRTTILSGNAVPDTYGDHIDDTDALRVLADATTAALEAAFPGADVTVDVQRASGCSPADDIRARDADGEDTAPSNNDEARVEHICGQVWEAWCEALGAGMESMEAALRQFSGAERARQLADDGLPSESGVNAAIPGEKVLGREAALEAYRAGERAALLDARDAAAEVGAA
jgi:hypothetical protein